MGTLARPLATKGRQALPVGRPFPNRRYGSTGGLGAAVLIASLCFSLSTNAVHGQGGASDQERHLAGQAALDRGDLDEAARQWMLGLIDAQQSGSPDRLASSQLDLAIVYTIRWQFPEASAALESARPALSSFGADAKFRADFVTAGYEAATSDFVTATRDLQDAIELAKTSLALGEDHPKTAILYSLLGLVELQSEQYSKANQDLQRALGILMETYGPEHIETAVARDRYALLLFTGGDYNQALQQAARAVDTARKLGPAARAVLGDALLTEGRINLAANRLAAAASDLQESLSVIRAVFGDRPPTVPVLTALAQLSLKRGNIGESSQLIKRATDLYNGDPVPNWLPAVEIFRESAEIAAHDQRPQDVGALIAEALRIATARLGSASLLAARVIETRGDLALDTGDLDRAEADFKQVMETRQRLLTPGHPDVGKGLTEIALVSAKRGLPAIAVDSLYKEAISSITAEHGDDSFSLIPTLEAYSSFLRSQKRDSEAEELDKKVRRMAAPE